MRMGRRALGLLAAGTLLWTAPAWAEGDYTLPGREPEEPPAQETPAPPEAEPASRPQFTLPGLEGAGEPQPEPEPQPETETSPEPEPGPTAEGPLTDQAYMEGLTLAFMDGVEELNPDRPTAQIQAVLVRAPEARMGSAQWFVNGEAQGEYYSGEFSIYNGRTTALELSIPFAKGMEDAVYRIALEVHLNGAVRRIEKEVAVRNYEDSWYDAREAARVFSLVKPVDIEAEVRYWTETYTSSGLGQADGSLGAGARVVYTDHAGEWAAKIWIPEQSRACWVPYDSIRISNRDYTVQGDFADTDKEIFVNAKGYASDTPYLIWINLERQRVNVFQGSQGQWDLVRVSTCSSGANETPTPTGVMTYCAYGDGWYHATYYVKPVLYLNVARGIAMHSILFNPNGSVQDGTQGTPVSHGCVRMPPAEVRWIADYVPVGTTVVVF